MDEISNDNSKEINLNDSNLSEKIIEYTTELFNNSNVNITKTAYLNEISFNIAYNYRYNYSTYYYYKYIFRTLSNENKKWLKNYKI